MIMGDRVILTSTYWNDSQHNPVWNGICGQVIGTLTPYDEYNDEGFVYSVVWDNGGSCRYRLNDLKLYIRPVILPEELFQL